MIHRFGIFEFDASTGELVKSGRRVRLAPQPAAVLERLLRAPGRLVTRESLRQALWGDDTVVDFDTSLNSCVKQVRAALGDAAASPRFVETLPRRGYRFIAEVAVVPDGPAPVVAATRARTPGARSARIGPAVLALSVVAVVALVGAGVLLRGAAPSPSDVAAAVPADDYLKARYLMGRGREGDLPKAVALLERATAAEPGYVPAHVSLAEAWLGRTFGGEVEPRTALARARAAAERALRLDPDDPRALAARARAVWRLEWDWSAADAGLRRAVALAPRDASLQQAYAAFLAARGDHDGAIRRIRLARALDPSSTVLNVDAAWYYIYARRYEEAIAESRRALGLEPDSFPALYSLATACSHAGRDDEGFDAYLRMMAVVGAPPALVERLRGMERPAAEREMERWWLAREAADAVPVYVRALVAVDRGDHDDAFRLLGRSVDERNGNVAVLAVDPRLDPLRADPRFAELLARMNL